MILRANLGAAVSLLGMGLATGPGMLLGFRIMQGFLTGTVTANLTLVVSKTPEQRLGFSRHPGGEFRAGGWRLCRSEQFKGAVTGAG